MNQHFISVRARITLKTVAHTLGSVAFFVGIALVLVGLSRVSDWVDENISNRTILLALGMLWVVGTALTIFERLRGPNQRSDDYTTDARDE